MTPPPMCATDGAPAGPGLPPLPGPAPLPCPLSYPIGTLRRRWHRSPALQRRPPPRRRSGSCRPPTTPQRGHQPRSTRHDPPRDGLHPEVAPPRARGWPTSFASSASLRPLAVARPSVAPTACPRPTCAASGTPANAWPPKGRVPSATSHVHTGLRDGGRERAPWRREQPLEMERFRDLITMRSLRRWRRAQGGEHVPPSARAAGASVASLTPNSSSALRRSSATSISSCATAHPTISRRPCASTSKLKRLELARLTPARGAASPLGERPPPRLPLICR
jgi:hypothetical protein